MGGGPTKLYTPHRVVKMSCVQGHILIINKTTAEIINMKIIKILLICSL